MKKTVLACIVAVVLATAVLAGCGQPAPSVKPPVTTDLPSWIEGNPSAYDTYTRAEKIMSNPDYSLRQKEEKMQVLQRTVGEELLTTIMRYVPVYDERTGTYVSFDDYMRGLARDFPSSDPRAPISCDPVGAAMRIFLDPSSETVAAMTGVGLSGQELAAARARFDEQQQEEAASRAAEEEKLRSAWEGVQQQTKAAVEGARVEVEKAQKNAQKAVDSAQHEVGRSVESAVNGAEQAVDQWIREAGKQVQEAGGSIGKGLEGILKGLGVP